MNAQTAAVAAAGFTNGPLGAPPYAKASDFTPWNGVPFDKSNSVPANVQCQRLFPSGNRYALIGLKDFYDQTKPFANEASPTIAELDAWNIAVINYFRRLYGQNVPLQNDPKQFLKAQWATEAKWTTKWDAENPPTPAFPKTKAHYGYGFVPKVSEQTPYLNAYTPPIPAFPSFPGGSETITFCKTEVPWALKMAFTLGSSLCAEGTGGHIAQLLGPGTDGQTLGFAWWMETNGYSELRIESPL
jgi:hypothetical protein